MTSSRDFSSTASGIEKLVVVPTLASNTLKKGQLVFMHKEGEPAGILQRAVVHEDVQKKKGNAGADTIVLIVFSESSRAAPKSTRWDDIVGFCPVDF